MTAPYETVCECGRSILRPPRPEIRPRWCGACEQAARDDAARAQLSLFAAVNPSLTTSCENTRA